MLAEYDLEWDLKDIDTRSLAYSPKFSILGFENKVYIVLERNFYTHKWSVTLCPDTHKNHHTQFRVDLMKQDVKINAARNRLEERIRRLSLFF